MKTNEASHEAASSFASLVTDANRHLPEIVELRRQIHAEPELGLHTPKTTEKARNALAGLPLEYHQGSSTTGFVAVLRGLADGPGRTVLLRGDMDALPLHEETGLSFASKFDGAMHACGHDAHTSMLVGAAKILGERRDQFSGTVMFMFQPGEEGHHGARFMMEDGLLDPSPDAAFALHVMPNAPFGVLCGKAGPLLASADQFHVTITGAGGHASMPHDAIDPVPIACEIVLAIQSFVTRRFAATDAVVITVGKLTSGTTDNIIPETAHLSGTIRALSPETRARAHEGLQRLAKGIAEAHRASAKVKLVEGFPVTICDAQAVALGKRVAGEIFGTGAWTTLADPVMGAEDFSYVLQAVPGAMFFLGAAEEGSDWRSCCGLHSNRMVLDENVMARGAALHAALAETFLAEGFAGRDSDADGR